MAEGGKSRRAAKPHEAAAAAGLQACMQAELCRPPQAKVWEKGAAFMAFLIASRKKQEDDKSNLGLNAAEAYPGCLDLWSVDHPDTLCEEVWGTHPLNKVKSKGEPPRMFTMDDSKKYRAPAAWGPGERGGELTEGLF